MGLFDRFKIKTSEDYTFRSKKEERIGSASSVFGSAQTTYSPIDSRDYSRVDARTFNINSSGASGSTITTKKEVTSTPSTSMEKPISVNPALFGGGSTTATGSGSAESGLNMSSIIGIAVVGGVALIVLPMILKKKKGGKK